MTVLVCLQDLFVAGADQPTSNIEGVIGLKFLTGQLLSLTVPTYPLILFLSTFFVSSMPIVFSVWLVPVIIENELSGYIQYNQCSVKNLQPKLLISHIYKRFE